MRIRGEQQLKKKCKKNPPRCEADHLFKDNIQKILLFDCFD